jgi:hypothetical protein
MRIAVLLSALLFVGCTVGDVGTTSNNNTGTDAGTADSAPISNANGCVPKGVAADAHMHQAGGTSNKGLSCVAAGCHLNGSLGTGADGTVAPAYQFAGTVYKPDGVTPYAGAIIPIYPNGGGAQVNLTADAEGNFYIGAGGVPMAFPATTAATVCPNITKMITQLMNTTAATGADCNFCHKTSGTAGGVIVAN